MSGYFGCIEAGGTKFNVGIAGADGVVSCTARFPTGDPGETLRRVVEFFRAEAGHDGLKAIGVASFGPVGLDRGSADWGRILDTPKPGWSGVSLVEPLAGFACPIGFDTDVNGAALAEARWGAAIGHAVSVYVTVGTGIGGGAVIDGRPLHGLRHPEMGHFHPKRHAEDADFAGICPFHGDCLEGLASGPAISARWGRSLSELPADHPAHRIIADYLAQMVMAQQAMLSPGRIALGGGVMATPGLLERVQQRSAELAAGYYPRPRNPEAVLVGAPGLGDRVGLLGALALAADASRSDVHPGAAADAHPFPPS